MEAAYLENNPEADPDSARPNLFIDRAEIAKPNFHRVTKPHSSANTTKPSPIPQSPRGTRETTAGPSRAPAALERQVPQNEGAAIAVGFASQNVDPYAYSAFTAAAPVPVSAAASMG
jgi:hypothetical protein